MYQGKLCQVRGLGQDHTNLFSCGKLRHILFDVHSPIIYTKTTKNANANGVSQTILKAEPRTELRFYCRLVKAKVLKTVPKIASYTIVSTEQRLRSF